MTRIPRRKKTETLDVRVSHEEKRAFMEAVSVMAEEQGAIRFDTQGGGQIAISVTPHRLAN